jgi:tRNA1Val (adenine37-N6)-methyltransferase
VGPEPSASPSTYSVQNAPPTELDIGEMDPSDLTRDRLIGGWSIFQLKRGHRFSVDDQITAVVAARRCPKATRICDIGAGIGSVGLMTLWQLEKEATLVMVEAQQISHQLAKRTIDFNHLQDRVDARRGDLREQTSIPESAHFHLVTGSPPYFPLGKGLASPHPQRAACRMELRGNVFGYANAAARILAPGGSFVLCFAAGDPRAEEALALSGFGIVERQDVVFREGRPPTICVLTGSLEWRGETERPPPITIRDAEGRWTGDFLAIKKSMRIEA